MKKCWHCGKEIDHGDFIEVPTWDALTWQDSEVKYLENGCVEDFRKENFGGLK